MLSLQQSPLRGQSLLTLQLQASCCWTILFVSLLLCSFMMFAMFSVQLQLTLTVFLLKISFSLCERGKCLSIRRKNVFEKFVETLVLNGGLNQMIFLFLPFKFLSGGLWEHLRIQVWNCWKFQYLKNFWITAHSWF